MRFGLRSRAQSLLRRLGVIRPRPIILMYHRIASPAVDPWALSISADAFDKQLRWLQSHRKVMALDDLVTRMNRGESVSSTVAITFDDGYRDNLDSGLPILKAHDCPATVFLATGLLGQAAEYWPDELARLILTGAAPLDTHIVIDGRRHDLLFPALQPADLAWQYHRAPAATPRQRAYLDIWQQLQTATDAIRTAAMDDLRALPFGAPPASPADFPLSPDEISALTSGGLISVGGHTRTHPHLPSCSPERQDAEIAGSLADCRDLTGLMPPGFAFPYGAIDLAAKDAVRRSGAKWAVSTRHCSIDTRNPDRFALPRLQVVNNDLEGFIEMIEAQI